MPEPQMHYVDSSNVEAVGYDPVEREVYVRFRNGRTYAYGDADETTFEELRAAASVGSYLNRVLKPGFPCREL
jgi:KTSC domain